MDVDETLRSVMNWGASIAAFFVGAAFFAFVVAVARYGAWDVLVRRHFATVVGLPSAAVAALFLVIVLRSVAGPIEFSFATFRFSGASGPLVMWMICFFAIALVIRLTWRLEFRE